MIREEFFGAGTGMENTWNEASVSAVENDEAVRRQRHRGEKADAVLCVLPCFDDCHVVREVMKAIAAGGCGKELRCFAIEKGQSFFFSVFSVIQISAFSGLKIDGRLLFGNR